MMSSLPDYDEISACHLMRLERYLWTFDRVPDHNVAEKEIDVSMCEDASAACIQGC